MNIVFNDTSAYTSGLIENLLLQSYEHIPITTLKDKQNFKQFDQDVSEHPHWIGTYVFITTVDHEPVGFVSFDPRQKPTALIGHNCILPVYSGKGFGTEQMKHALSEIEKQGFKKATVTTCDNDYFIPARRMYKSCGFKEINKFYNGNNAVKMVGYELNFEK